MVINADLLKNIVSLNCGHFLIGTHLITEMIRSLSFVTTSIICLMKSGDTGANSVPEVVK